MNRVVKKILYGVFFLTIWVVIGGLIYWYITQERPSCDDGIINQDEGGVDCGGVCLPCAFKNLQALEVFPVNIFDNGNQTTSVLIELLNKNKELGITNLPYTINLYDNSGNKIFSLNKDIQIKPGARQYIVAAGLAVDPVLVGRGELVLEEPKWELVEKQAPLLLVNPGFQIAKESNRVMIVGRALNRNPFSISEAEIQVLLLNQLGFYVSASKTVLRNIPSDSATDFQVNFVLKPETLGTIDFSKTKVIVEAKK